MLVNSEKSTPYSFELIHCGKGTDNRGCTFSTKDLEKIKHPFKLTYLLTTSQTLASTSTEFLGKLQTQYIIEPSALTHAFHICKVGWPRFLAARIAAPAYRIQIYGGLLTIDQPVDQRCKLFKPISNHL